MIEKNMTGRVWLGLVALGLWLTPLGQAEVHVTDTWWWWSMPPARWAHQ